MQSKWADSLKRTEKLLVHSWRPRQVKSAPNTGTCPVVAGTAPGLTKQFRTLIASLYLSALVLLMSFKAAFLWTRRLVIFLHWIPQPFLQLNGDYHFCEVLVLRWKLNFVWRWPFSLTEILALFRRRGWGKSGLALWIALAVFWAHPAALYYIWRADALFLWGVVGWLMSLARFCPHRSGSAVVPLHKEPGRGGVTWHCLPSGMYWLCTALSNEMAEVRRAPPCYTLSKLRRKCQKTSE